jgi:large subunit ribosomal protein L4e
MSRPQVTVYNAEKERGKDKGLEQKGQTALPDVFSAPIRTDIVNRMHSQLKMNLRHPYAVSRWAGHQTAAESWGTGRAVSRIPRVPGSGTHRAGQGAFGNMCRGGRMFSPSKVWRRWMHKVKKNERRYATASALAASSISALVMARGHKVERLAEVPFVVSDEIQAYTKTSQAFKFLKRARAIDDCRRVKASVKINPGRGKSRNRRYKQAIGPLVIYKENKGLVNAFRNIPGVETASVDRLNLLQLAPGGHVGRFIIWTEAAFKDLNTRFGTYGAKGDSKHLTRNGTTYRLPRAVMQNTDVEKIIQSDEVQSAIRDRKIAKKKPVLKKNPLKNLFAMVKLNPLALSQRRQTILKIQANIHKKALKKKLGKDWKPNKKEVAKTQYLAKTAKVRADTKKRYLENVLKVESKK